MAVRTPLKKHKELVRNLLHDAIKEGIIIRPDKCSSCGIKCKPDGHHDDYDKPLKIIWLCKKCHHATHRSVIENLLKAAEELISKATPKLIKKWRTVIIKAKKQLES